MEINIFKTPDEAIRNLADYFVQIVHTAITENGVANVVLTGGHSPRKLYSLLSSPEYREQLDWSKIRFFFGDERHVPFNDTDNNGSMVKTFLFDPLGIPVKNIFYMDTRLAPEQSAKQYEQLIRAEIPVEPVRFDFILLGLGDNAHTASLFPHTSALQDNGELVLPVYVEELKANRITLTASLINQAHAIAFLVFGSSKAYAVCNVLKGERNSDRYPAQLIDPKDGVAHWFMDEAAANEL